MSQPSITVAERLTYTDNFKDRVENMGNVVWPLFEKTVVEGNMKRIDFIGNIESTQTANSRFTPIVGVDPVHTNRWISTAANEQAVFVDRKDINNVVMDPKSKYMDKIVNAFVRRREDVVFTAMGASVLTGETGTGAAATFDTTNNEIAAGGTDLTLEKLQDALFTLETRAYAHQNPGVTKYFVYTPAQKRSLLRTTEVTNSDYNIIKALVEGQIEHYMGFTFLTSTQVPSGDGLAIGSSTNRYCYAFTNDVMLLGEGISRITDVHERKDLTKVPWQLYAMEDIGAMRQEEEKIVRVICDETA